MGKRLLALGVMLGLILAGLTLSTAGSSEAGVSSASSPTASPQSRHTITVTPIGPTQEQVDQAKLRALKHPSLRGLLKDTEHRMISFELTGGGKTGETALMADGFKATIFDYTNNRAFGCSGRLDGGDVRVSSLLEQPHPDVEEFEAAVEIVSRDQELGAAIAIRQLQPYAPMPPLVNSQAPVGKGNRTIAVGLMPTGIKNENQIVGVDMITKTIVRFPGNAPAAASASPATCGLTSAGGSNPRGLAGQALIVISRDGVELWRFEVVRPSASVGTKGSAVELLNVSYRGKKILARANVPILNVQYDRNACGPYRDWQYQEGEFTANAAAIPNPNPAPGIRICGSPPQTILESGSDAGNFRGVGIYDNNEEVVVVSELNAGWYRYISRWTFTDAGVIKPRFGFGATFNSCVCNIHNHHAYWRFDFDVVTAANNVVFEHLPPKITTIEKEGMRARLDRLNHTWTIVNSVSGETVLVRPGPWDKNFDKYGKGDLWVLLSKAPAEMDDGVSCTTCIASYINLNPFVNGESVANQDLVVWYGAHFNHINGNVACGTSAGPDIEITRW